MNKHLSKKFKMDEQGKLVVTALVIVGLLTLSIVVAYPKGFAQGINECNDKIDNDADGLIDWKLDPGCSSRRDASELNVAIACDDGVNNDYDNLTDTKDTGCFSVTDNSELNSAIECDDGLDNDGDAFIDLQDKGCSSTTDADETNCGDAVCEGGETQLDCTQDCGFADSCSDSDGGDFVNIFGTTSGYSNNTPYTHNDYCTDVSNVREYYCSGTFEQSQMQGCGTDFYSPNYCVSSSVYKDLTDYSCSSGACNSNTTREFIENCAYGCTNGTCNPPTDSCTDSDGGLVYTLLGNVTGYANNTAYIKSDYCLSNTTLTEYYCNGTKSGTAGYTCSNNITQACLNGACI